MTNSENTYDNQLFITLIQISLGVIDQEDKTRPAELSVLENQFSNMKTEAGFNGNSKTIKESLDKLGKEIKILKTQVKTMPVKKQDSEANFNSKSELDKMLPDINELNQFASNN